MTKIVFTYAATPLGDGRHRVNLYLKQFEPEFNDGIRSELKAQSDAAMIVRDLVRVNADDAGDRLLSDGEPPTDALRICFFELLVGWNRKEKLPQYRFGEYQRLEWEPKWTSIAALMMEQRAYMMGVLKKRVRHDLAEKNAAKAKKREEFLKSLENQQKGRQP